MNKFVTNKYDKFEKNTTIKANNEILFMGRSSENEIIRFRGTLSGVIHNEEEPIFLLTLKIQDAFKPYFPFFKDNSIYDSQLRICLLLEDEIFPLDLKSKYREENGNINIGNFGFSTAVLKKICDSSTVEMRISCEGASLTCDYKLNGDFIIYARALYNAAIDESLYADYLDEEYIKQQKDKARVDKIFEREQKKEKQKQETKDKISSLVKKLNEDLHNVWNKFGEHGSFAAGYEMISSRFGKQGFIEKFCYSDANLVYRRRLIKEIDNAISFYEAFIAEIDALKIPKSQEIYGTYTLQDYIDSLTCLREARTKQKDIITKKTLTISIVSIVSIIGFVLFIVDFDPNDRLGVLLVSLFIVVPIIALVDWGLIALIYRIIGVTNKNN